MRRPKVLILLALLTLFAAACGDDGYGGGGDDASDTTDTTEGPDDGETAVLDLDQRDVQVAVGDTVVVELEENGSIGDDWEFREEPDEGVLRFDGDDYESDDPEAAGSGGTVRFSFEAVGDGGTQFTLYNCYRCSDGEPSETPPEPAEVEFSVEVTA
jgi:predicted secreted protein